MDKLVKPFCITSLTTFAEYCILVLATGSCLQIHHNLHHSDCKWNVALELVNLELLIKSLVNSFAFTSATLVPSTGQHLFPSMYLQFYMFLHFRRILNHARKHQHYILCLAHLSYYKYILQNLLHYLQPVAESKQ